MTKYVSKVFEFIDEYWNKKTRDPGLFDVFGENLMYRNISGRRVGREGYKINSKDWDDAFPDYQMKLKKVKVINSTVITSYECSGSYINPLADHPKDVVEDSGFTQIIQLADTKQKLIPHEVEWTFIFHKDHAVHLYCHSDIKKFYQQLGIDQYLKIPTKNEILSGDKNRLLEKIHTFCNLTSREIECMAIALSGFSSSSIGKFLFISARTVETHLKNAYEKLQCNSKQQCLEMMYSNKTLTIWQEFCKLLLDKKL